MFRCDEPARAVRIITRSKSPEVTGPGASDDLNLNLTLVVGGDGEVAQLRDAVAAVPAARDEGLRG